MSNRLDIYDEMVAEIDAELGVNKVVVERAGKDTPFIAVVELP